MFAKTSTAVIFLLACSAVVCSGQTLVPKKVRVNGVDLHYVEKGSGEPLILIHGGVGDYRSWENQFEEFAKTHRVISYSRRYSFPNNNSLDSRYRAVVTEADDLAAFIKYLKLKRPHLLGLSYGAYAALVLAVKHPGLAGSMVLAEPPVLQLIRDTPDGEKVYQGFRGDLQPVADAFRENDDRLAMTSFNRAMGRDFDKLPKPAAEAMMQNVLALKAINLSPEPFPAISKAKLRQLYIPTLILTGEHTMKINTLIDQALTRLLPNAKHVVVPNSGHALPRENPQFFNRLVLEFLSARK